MCLWEYLPHVCRCLEKAKDDVLFFGTVVIDVRCLMWAWEPNLDPLKMSQAFFTTETSFQPNFLYTSNNYSTSSALFLEQNCA